MSILKLWYTYELKYLPGFPFVYLILAWSYYSNSKYSFYYPFMEHVEKVRTGIINLPLWCFLSHTASAEVIVKSIPYIQLLLNSLKQITFRQKKWVFPILFVVVLVILPPTRNIIILVSGPYNCYHLTNTIGVICKLFGSYQLRSNHYFHLICGIPLGITIHLLASVYST